MFIALNFFALFGGIMVLLAFLGLGRIVQRFTQEGSTISETIALGFGVNLLIGGVLNFVGAISLGSVLAVEVVGLCGLYFERHKFIPKMKLYCKDPYAIAILALFYVLSVTNVAFNWNDDFNGYLIIVEKLIQTHRLGSEPFLQQRVLSLGSYFYSQASYVMQFGYEHLSLLDPGIGRVIIGLLLIERLQNRFDAYRYLSLLLLTSGLIVAWAWNTTAPLTILTALLALLTFEVVDEKNRPCFFGLLAGAAVSLKVTALPYISLLAITAFLSLARGRHVWNAVRAALLASLSGAAILLPWMVSLYFSSGTLMYPVLGQGYIAFPPVRFFDWNVLWYSARTQTHFVFGILLVLLGAVVLIVKSKQPSRSLIASAAGGTLLSVSLVLYGTGAGGDSVRYILPVCAPLGIVLLVKFMDDEVLRSYSAKMIFAALALICAVTLIPARAFVTINSGNLLALLSGRMQSLEAVFSRRYSLRKAQQLVPEHERILTFTDAASMLDFVHNPIWATGDNPGESSPPPGLLRMDSPSELRNYLLGLGIRYVLFEPGISKLVDIEKKLASPTEAYLNNPWDYNEIIAAKHVFQSVAQLAEQSRVLHSDKYQVIGLISPSH